MSSDYFDVVPFFQLRAERPFAARALWLDHGAGVPGEVSADDLPSGARAMLKAFTQVRVLRGDTTQALADCVDATPEVGTAQPGADWKAAWESRFAPLAWQRHLYAAQLYASLGMGRRSLDSALLARAASAPDGPRLRQYLANGLRDCGCYAAEIEFRRATANSPADTPASAEEHLFQSRQWAAALRLGRRHLSAWRAYGKLVREALGDTPASTGLADERVWALAEAALFYRDGLIRLPASRWFRPLASAFQGRIRHLIDEARQRYPDSGRDPHLLAMLHRLELTLSSAPGVPRGATPAVRADEEAAFQPGDLYRETDSLLGQINVARDQARQFLSQRRTILARDNLLRSWRLARLIEDRPGAIKACRMLAELTHGQRRRHLLRLAGLYADMIEADCARHRRQL